MMCYWCYWGWPKPIRDVYDKAVSALGGYTDPLHFGPAHVVWDDECWGHANWCLDWFDESKQNRSRGRFSDDELEVVRQSLIDLIVVPDEFKYVPKYYDFEHPENFPPPAHWVMVKA